MLSCGIYKSIGIRQCSEGIVPTFFSLLRKLPLVTNLERLFDRFLCLETKPFLQIISHGFLHVALFFLARMNYDIIHLVYLDEMGQIAIPMPIIFTIVFPSIR